MSVPKQRNNGHVGVIVDVFVFAREGAVKGNCELKKI